MELQLDLEAQSGGQCVAVDARRGGDILKVRLNVYARHELHSVEQLDHRLLIRPALKELGPSNAYAKNVVVPLRDQAGVEETGDKTVSYPF
jgi:hypothetical protein